MRRLPLCALLTGLLVSCAHVVPPDNDTPLAAGSGGGSSAGNGGAAGSGDAGAGGTSAGGAGASQAGAGGKGNAGTAGTAGKGGGSAGSGQAGAGGGSAGQGQAGAGGSLSGCGDKTIKINEFAVAGPNGANDEFIELFNSGTCAVKLDGWVIKYSSKSGSSPSNRWTGTSSHSIDPGGFFLLASPDFSGSPDDMLMAGMSADGGGIGIFSSDGSKTAIDSVAWKSATASNPMAEGDPTENPGMDSSVARNHDGDDSNDNATDFNATATPSPGQPN
jgi:hypothetical protein